MNTVNLRQSGLSVAQDIIVSNAYPRKKGQWKVNTDTSGKYPDEANRLKINNLMSSSLGLFIFNQISVIIFTTNNKMLI